MYDAKLDYCVAHRWRRAEMLSPVPHRGKKKPLFLSSPGIHWSSISTSVSPLDCSPICTKWKTNKNKTKSLRLILDWPLKLLPNLLALVNFWFYTQDYPYVCTIRMHNFSQVDCMPLQSINVEEDEADKTGSNKKTRDWMTIKVCSKYSYPSILVPNPIVNIVWYSTTWVASTSLLFLVIRSVRLLLLLFSNINSESASVEW